MREYFWQAAVGSVEGPYSFFDPSELAAEFDTTHMGQWHPVSFVPDADGDVTVLWRRVIILCDSKLYDSEYESWCEDEALLAAEEADAV